MQITPQYTHTYSIFKPETTVILISHTLGHINYVWKFEKSTIICINWLKSLKDRVQPKQEWSKEDEWKFSDILALLRGGENFHYNTPDLFTWFKSLKDRIQL